MRFAIPGLLVEYLINGVVALLWLIPLTRNGDPGINPLYIAPGIYVLGMLVDIVAFIVTQYPKRWIRNRAARKRGLPEAGSGTRRKVKIELYAPELAQEAERRSSRDRIARGTIVNFVLIAVFSDVISVHASAVVVILSCLMWLFFEYSSFTYALEAERAVDHKLQREETKNVV